MMKICLLNSFVYRVRCANIIYKFSTDSIGGDKKSSGSSVGKIFDKPVAESRSGTTAPAPVPSSAKVDHVDDVVAVSGVPEEHVINRKARIFVPARVAAQSGVDNTRVWKVELDNRERWENQLMGWTSSGDPLSNISGALNLATKEDAVRFCQRQGWEYEVEEPQRQKIKPKSYGTNYDWNSNKKIWTK